jgi:zinc/manganese transport system ATP-binding protein
VTPVLRIRDASLGFGGSTLWSGLNLDLDSGEFVAVLGPNGSGKSSLLKAILGQQPLDSGAIELRGAPVQRGSKNIGYVPQQKLLDRGTPIRARDLVAFGLNGHRWGFPLPSKKVRARVDAVLADVGAAEYGDSPVATLSGGEQQRLRIGQAVIAEPSLLLCDEPLISLDLNHQREVSELLNRQRKATGAAVLFVTHDVNPVLDMVDRVLYLAGGRFSIGTPDEVLRTDVLSQLYGTQVEVLRLDGRIIVVGAPEHHGEHEHAAEVA